MMKLKNACLSEFDYFIQHMDKEDPIFLNHRTHIKAIPPTSDVLIKILEEDLEDGSISWVGDSEICSEILMQLLYSFYLRCENKSSIRSFFSKDSLYGFVDIMLSGIKKA